jgi:hypothetical protein
LEAPDCHFHGEAGLEPLRLLPRLGFMEFAAIEFAAVAQIWPHGGCSPDEIAVLNERNRDE